MIRKQRADHHQFLCNRFGGPKKERYAELNKIYNLPPINCPAVTREYLKLVGEHRVLMVARAHFKEYLVLDVSKEVAFCIFSDVADKKRYQVGFDITRLPSRAWMLSVAYSVDPNHPAFVKPNMIRDLELAMVNLQNPTGVLGRIIDDQPSPFDLAMAYRNRIITAYKLIITVRAGRLAEEYSFCRIDWRVLDKIN